MQAYDNQEYEVIDYLSAVSAALWIRHLIIDIIGFTILGLYDIGI